MWVNIPKSHKSISDVLLSKNVGLNAVLAKEQNICLAFLFVLYFSGRASSYNSGR
jgi:hypothetical protein